MQKGLDSRLSESKTQGNTKRQRIEEGGGNEEDPETIDQPAAKRAKKEIE